MKEIIFSLFMACLLLLASSAQAAKPLIGLSGYVSLPKTKEGGRWGSYKLSRPYRDALIKAGAVPVHLVPVAAEDVDFVLDRLDGLLLCGGPDLDPALYGQKPHPSVRVLSRERQVFDIALARRAMERRMPILGICLGSQILNVVSGGSLVQDIPSLVDNALEHRDLKHPAKLDGPMHAIRLVKGSRLASFYDESLIYVNGAHHQAVERPGKGLAVSARAPDGVVEGFEMPGYPFLIGVQYHPERQYRPKGLHDKLFTEFVRAAMIYARRE